MSEHVVESGDEAAEVGAGQAPVACLELLEQPRDDVHVGQLRMVPALAPSVLAGAVVRVPLGDGLVGAGDAHPDAEPPEVGQLVCRSRTYEGLTIATVQVCEDKAFLRVK